MTDKRNEPPGANSERTIFQPARPAPVPGGGGGGGGFTPRAAPQAAPGAGAPTAYAPPQQPQAPQHTGPARLDFAAAEPQLFGPEPLVAAAGRLIHLASRVKTMAIGPDMNELRRLVVRELEAFKKRAQGLGFETKTIQLAHYILCAFMDDAVMSTPWGANSQWSQQSLLIAYHNDAQGGDRLFDFAERMAQDPLREPRLMELLYQCLALGFEGRAALDQRSAALLQQRRSRLAEAIRVKQGAPTGELSPQWKGVEALGGRYEPRIPLWTILTVIGVVALLIFAALLFRLGSKADAALAALNQVVGHAEIVPPPPAAPEAQTGTFDKISSILAPDVAAGRLSVLNEGNDIVLRLNNQGLFESAAADPSGEWSDTFGRLAQAANLTKGPIRIEGHTDNQALRQSLLYPSNAELSVARAEAVGQAVGGAGLTDPARINAKGLSDAQPIADNATAEGRRQNRRVELHVANDIAWR